MADLYRLLQDMREFTDRTGWGLAETWGLVRQAKFAEARERMDALLSDERSPTTGRLLAPNPTNPKGTPR
jgi:hypothetical protein